jgi:hypothetical protein
MKNGIFILFLNEISCLKFGEILVGVLVEKVSSGAFSHGLNIFAKFPFFFC